MLKPAIFQQQFVALRNLAFLCGDTTSAPRISSAAMEEEHVKLFVASAFALFCLSAVGGHAQTDPEHHGSITGAYEYLDAQGADHSYTSLHGFDAVTALAVSKNSDLFFSFNGFYKNGEHVNGFTGGPLYKLRPIGRVTPLGFTEVGDSRTWLKAW